MFVNHYIDWTRSRMEGVRKYIPQSFWTGKTLLEVGAGHAHNGNEFSKLGAEVTACDARTEHLEVVNSLYPHINTFVLDADKDKITRHYDVILHWGLLYHVQNIKEHLTDVCHNCDFLLLETEVADSDDPNFVLKTLEEGYDQAFNSIGSRPSEKYVEEILRTNGFVFQMITDPIINSGFHHYNWTIKNTNNWEKGMRRFWICARKRLHREIFG